MRKLLFLVFVLTVQLTMAQKSALSPMDVAMIKTVGSAVMSEDGSKIAYTITEPTDPTKENSQASAKLWLYDVKNGTSSPFVTTGSVRGVAFRPKSNTITFLSKRTGDAGSCLYEIPVTGGEAVKIHDHATSISSYEWSSDGLKFVFLADEKKEKKSTLPYSPIIFEENLTLTRAFIATPEAPAIEITAVPGQCYAAHWSPDKQKIAIAAAPTALVDDSYMKQVIHIVDAVTLQAKSSVSHQAKLGEIAWNPDSKSIAFISGADIHDPAAECLFVTDIAKVNSKILLPEFKGKIEKIDWMDDKTIRFIVSEGVYCTMATVGSDGKGMKKSIDKGNTIFTAFSAASNGSLAMVGSSATHPAELFLFDGSTAKKLTDSNPWLSDKLMGSQEVVTYKAKDGLELEGILILPVDYKKGTKYPLITVVHGGPESHYSNGWLTGYSTPGHSGAAAGYSVFYPNYRGSTGRGVSFSKSSQGDPAGLEFDDIVDGIDFLIEKGIVDKTKVGVTGGSYGGYATAWMSTKYTDRFAAGVMFVGISNNISKWGTSDIPEEMYYVHELNHIYDDYDFYLKRSPIYYAGQAKTPLLIAAGAGDTRVDPGQSKELYRHIKTRTQTPVRLVLYPGEGHGNRNATARFDYNIRLMQWFDTYLMKSDGAIPSAEIQPE